MRILSDECLPVLMRDCITSHECTAVSDRGWKGIKNGELLRLAEGQFDLFITADQNIRYQQNLSDRLMRALLVDRFKMVTHYEDRPVDAYTLVADKPKLKKAA